MKFNNSSQLRWALLGIAVGLAFLWLSMRNADLQESWLALTDLRAQWVLPILVSALAFIAIKSYRWYLLLASALPAGAGFAEGYFGMLHRAVYAGTAANLVLAHTGEVLRATLISRRNGPAASAVLASIALERVLDFVALLILIGLAIVIDPNVSTLLWSAALVSLALVIAGLVVLTTVLGSGGTRVRQLLRWPLQFLPERIANWLVLQVGKSQQGLGAMREPSTLVKVLILSLAQWSCIVLSIWACAAAIGVQIPMSGAIVIFVLTVIGLTLPSSPAQLGTVQLAFVAGMTAMNAPASAAFAASLLYTALFNGTMMTIGAICWIRWPHTKGAGQESGEEIKEPAT